MTPHSEARRDEEKSRAKERIFSFRSDQHRWEPKNQRPELWNIYNNRIHKGESMRIFTLSYWTELDVWQYIHHENIPIVPPYFAEEIPVVGRYGMLVVADDDRMPLEKDEKVEMKQVRFRTLGCYPLTGAVESSAKTNIVKSIVTFNGDLDSASTNQAITLTLKDEIDVSRGDVISEIDIRPEITELKYKVNVNSLEHEADKVLELNEVGICNLSVDDPIVFDAYQENMP